MAYRSRSRGSRSRSSYARASSRSRRAAPRRATSRRGSRASASPRTIRIVIAGESQNAVARPGMPFGVAAPAAKKAQF